MDIAGAELLTAVFGRWPSFHDAEVIRLSLERSESDAGPDLVADVHAFETTGEVGPDGCYVLRHHTLVTLRFRGIDQLGIRGFNNQNVLMSLDIEDIRSRQLEELKYLVRLDGSYGVEAAFLCREAVVESVRPWTGRQA